MPKKYNADSYHLEFVTTDGRKITETAKCGGKKRFDNFYSNLKVVYHLDEPENYLELPYFQNYSLGYKVFFFFGPYGMIGTIILYAFLTLGNMFEVKNDEK